MKIVIVLCSLATFAIAVPVYQENVFESSLSNQASSTKRERKSPLLDITPGLFLEHGIEKNPNHSNKESDHGTSLEAKSFRRPIIIKRKLGYHVYRDSDEEMAYTEPGEKCREHVKFKLCDQTPVSSSKNGIKSPTFKCLNNHKTDNEMENSIKMAKEAVEHLQKDLKRMENFSAKMANPNIEDIESKSGLHHDIEIAREALEHIEQNFESENLEVNKANELLIPKSQDEERLTRWREAIDNIHKNFEIVKNIEDAFNFDNHLSLFRSDSRKVVESEEPKHSEGHVYVQQKFSNDNLENNNEVYNEVKILKSALSEDEIAQLTPNTENVDNVGKDAGNDMFVSPTENREDKIQLHSDSLKSEINYKDTSLRSDVSKIESSKHDTNVPKESIEYSVKNSNSLSESNPEFKNENSPLERLSLGLMSTKIENSKNSEAGEDEKNYSDKYDNKVIENKENKFKSYNTNMRLSDDRLDKSEQLSVDNFDSIDRHIIQSPQLFSLKEKNVFSGEENAQNEHKTHHIINDNHEFYESLSNSKQDAKDRSHNFKYTDEYKNIKSSEIQDGQLGSRMTQNQELNKFSFLNDKNQFANQYTNEEEMRMSITQNRNANEDRKLQFLKSGPELYTDPMLSMPTETVDISDGQHSHKSQASVRLSQAQTEKLQLNEYPEGAEQHASTRFDIENNSDDTKIQLLKSVPELQPYPIALLSTDKADNTNDQQSHGEEASMRSSESQNENIQSNDNQEVHEPLPIGLDIERHPEDHKRQFLKSVPELSYDTMVSVPKENVDISDDQHANKEEFSMRTSENQNDKMQSNENQEVHEPLPIVLDMEREAEKRIWQYSKSVPDLPIEPMASMPTRKVDITDSLNPRKGEASMRSSDIQSDKLQLNKYQEDPEHASTILNIENNSDDSTSHFFKSVPELQPYSIAPLPSDKVDINYDQQSHKEESSMRSSENQNDKMQSNENQKLHEPLPMGSDIERNSEERIWQLSKSVPELPYDSMISMATENVDIAHAYEGEASMKSSESQSEKLQLNKYQENPEHASTILNIENTSDDSESKFFKSVSEQQLYPIESLPSDKVDITNDLQSYREEARMRSSESQNDKMQSNEYQGVHEPLPMGSHIKHHPDELTTQYSKSVPELPYDPMVAMALKKTDINDDQHAHKGDESMRLSENQNEKTQLNAYQDEPELASTRLNIENNSGDTKTSFFKSVSEMQPMPTDKVDIINDQQSYREKASMRSAVSQNEKMQSNENQEVHEPLPMGLDIERHPEERTWQLSKSVPELAYYSMASMATEKVDITDDTHTHKEESSMRASENQNDKMQSNENQELHVPLPIGFDIERHPEERAWQLSKSSLELPFDPMASMATEKVDITDDPHTHKEESSMRASENQNDKMQSNENQELHVPLPIGFDNERHPEERSWQLSKSSPELPFDPMVSMETEKVDIINDQHTHKGDQSMRSSENQNDKMQSNENQELHVPLPIRFDNERHPEERSWQLSKSSSELPFDPMVSMETEKVDITDDTHTHKEESSMRASENQNDKMQSNENQELHVPLPIGFDIERHPEERAWQLSKSSLELPFDPMASMATEKVDITDDPHTHKEESSMRASENQNDKMQSNENQELHVPLPIGFDNERHPEERSWQLSKSSPELPFDPMVSMETEKVDIINDQHTHKGDQSMRSSENQNDKMQSNENQELHVPLPIGFAIERHPEERSWQLSKSSPELPFGPMVLMETEKVDINNDQHTHKGDQSMRSAVSQNGKMQSNENQELHVPLPIGFDNERHPEERSWQLSKSSPELPFDPMVSMETEKVDITDDTHTHKEESSMRASENQNDKMQSNENQELHVPLPMGLDFERHPEEHTSHLSKSVPELIYDPMVSMATGKVDIINDQYSYTGDASIRESETQNENLQLNDYKEEPEHLAMRFYLENNDGSHNSQFLKSVAELHSDSIVSLPTDKIHINNAQDTDKEKAGMRLTQTQNEKLQLNKIEEAHEPLMMRLDMTNHPEDRKWQFSKSVPELPYDSMASMATDQVEITNEQQSLKEGNMRLSQNQNEKTQFHENHGRQVFFPTKPGIEHHLGHSTSQFFKSVPEIYTSRSNINHVNNENFYFPEDAKLSQNENVRQHIYFNQHLYEPLSSRLDNEKKFEEDSLTADKVRFSYRQNPMKEQTTMRLSQNENENKEIQYPSTSSGSSNEHMNREDNAEHPINDNMHLSIAQHQQLHENRNSMLRPSNDRLHLSHNFKSYKMLPATSQFEFRNGQNGFNDHTNMRINEQQSRDPEPMENRNLHNSISMLWNPENQHQDLSPNTFKSNSDFDHTLLKSNEFDNEQFLPHQISKPGNTLEYRNRPQLFGDHILDDTQSSRWYQTKQHNDHFTNYYKTIPEMHEEYMNPHFRRQLHRVAVNHKLNDADTFSSYDFPSSRLHDHMQTYHQEKSSNIDSSLEPSMHMNMKEPFAKAGTEFSNMHFNHPHGTARFGAGLPIAGVNSGAVGVFPTANTGGCGIPLLLSCSPSVVSGSLARPHIAGPVFKTVDENFKYYMKRDAKNIADVPDINIQNTLFPHHGTGTTSEI